MVRPIQGPGRYPRPIVSVSGAAVIVLVALLIASAFPAVLLLRAAASPPNRPLAGSGFNVDFTETGLILLTQWSVDLNGTTKSSTGSTISFSEPNGSYNYTVPSLTLYSPSPASGTVAVNGNNSAVNVTFGALGATVYFNETGLPASTNWSVTFNAVTHSSTSATISFSASAGTYNYTVGTVVGYHPSPGSGSVIVLLTVQTVNISWSQVQYPVSFSETGLPTGTHWGVDLNGTSNTSSGPWVNFTEGNGSYSYTVAVPTGEHATPASGTVSVSGAGTSKSIAFNATNYTVTFQESGLPSGTTWEVTFNGVHHTGSGTTRTFAAPNGNYSYQIPNAGSYRPSPSSGSVAVQGGNATVPVTFSLNTFGVTFSRSGLPGGTEWFVVFNGTNQSSTTGQIVFSAANGSQSSFTVGTLVPAEWAANPSSGTVTVNGKSQTVPIAFSVRSYDVSVVESGLASGLTWSVTYKNASGGGGTASAVSPSALLLSALRYGPYTFTVGRVSGYHSTPSSGGFTSNRSGETVTVSFRSFNATFPVIFTESGLHNQSWSVTVSNSTGIPITNYSTTNTLRFSLPNVTFQFVVGDVGRYVPSPQSGQFTVLGIRIDIAVGYVLAPFELTFVESGLPSGTVWAVSLGKVLQSSSNSTVVFPVTSGTRDFVVVAIRGYAASPPSGSVDVTGSQQVPIHFSLVAYVVTFQEIGLAPKTNWSVDFNGAVNSSSGPWINFSALSGTYPYTVVPIPGYRASAYSGSLNVSGQNSTELVPWLPVQYSVLFRESGLPTGATWTLTFDGKEYSTVNSSITLLASNGTYPFQVGSSVPYVPSPNSGWVQVQGPGTVTVVAFTHALSILQTLARYAPYLGAGVVVLALLLFLVVRQRRRSRSARRPPPRPFQPPTVPPGAAGPGARRPTSTAPSGGTEVADDFAEGAAPGTFRRPNR